MITLKIAWRYLFSSKSHSVVNTISWVSMVAMAVPVMAMVIILSLHNGLSSYLEDMYKDFDAPMQISYGVADRVFECDSVLMAEISSVEGVGSVSRVIRQNVLLVAQESGSHAVATIVGVDSLYGMVVPLQERVVAGRFDNLTKGSRDALLGQGLAYELGVNLGAYEPVEVFALGTKSEVRSLFDYAQYSSVSLMPKGVYRLDMQSDSKYVFTEISVVRELMGRGENEVSSLEVALNQGYSYENVAQRIRPLVEPQGLMVRSRFEQKETMYKVVQGEKVIIYALLVMVLCIAGLSLAGQTSMLVAEKRSEIRTLGVMGCSRGMIGRVFLYQGLLIVGLGCLVGVVLGLGFCFLQQQFGVIQMSGSSFVMENYPVQVRIGDLMLVVSTVMLLGASLLGIVSGIVIRERR